jgi:hypothetical protein
MSPTRSQNTTSIDHEYAQDQSAIITLLIQPTQLIALDIPTSVRMSPNRHCAEVRLLLTLKTPSAQAPNAAGR